MDQDAGSTSTGTSDLREWPDAASGPAVRSRSQARNAGFGAPKCPAGVAWAAGAASAAVAPATTIAAATRVSDRRRERVM